MIIDHLDSFSENEKELFWENITNYDFWKNYDHPDRPFPYEYPFKVSEDEIIQNDLDPVDYYSDEYWEATEKFYNNLCPKHIAQLYESYEIQIRDIIQFYTQSGFNILNFNPIIYFNCKKSLKWLKDQKSILIIKDYVYQDCYMINDNDAFDYYRVFIEKNLYARSSYSSGKFFKIPSSVNVLQVIERLNITEVVNTPNGGEYIFANADDYIAVKLAMD